MKTWSIAAFLLMLLMSTVGQAQQIITVNTNGSFERSDVTVSGDTSSVEGWTFELQDAAVATFAIVDSVVKDSSRALQISVETAGANEWSIQAINEPFKVIPGNQYNFKVWAKSDVAATANFTVGNPAYNEFARQGGVSLTSEWQEVSLNFTPGAADTVGRAPLHFSFAGNEGGKIWIDSLRVTTEVDTTPPLLPIADGKIKWLGNIYSNSQITEFTEHWNQVTPENAGKWGSVEATRDQMNWSTLDAAYALAKDNGFPFRFHVLVWGNQQPTWMKELSEEEQLEEIEEWFQAVADRYPEIDYLEVVNEPLHDPPTDQDNEPGSGGYIDALGGTGDTGWDWVITAFEMARDIFPANTKLMINDYNIVNSQSNAEQYVQIIKLLQERGLIDRVGVQSHAFSNGSNLQNTSITPAFQKAILDYIYDETELYIWATEMDIDGDEGASAAAQDQYQLGKYQGIFPVYWKHPAVEGVTLWGWRPGLWRNNEQAYLVDESGDNRPAFDWLRAFVDTASIELYEPFVDLYDPIAENKPKWLGNVHSEDQLDRFLNYWNQVTPENSGKWGSIEGARDQMNWTQIDAAYNMAKNNRLKFRFHVLIWGAQQPAWMNDLGPEEQLEEIREWFEAVAERYPDIDYIEVVNEPLHQRPDGVTGEADYWEALGGEGETGFDWIITAFEMAREIFPAKTKLMINDYGIISSSRSVTSYLEIINALKERNLIDRIGVQSHAFNNGSSLASGTTPGTIKRNLDALATANLPIQVTELDIDGNPNLDEDGSDDYQLEKMKQIFPVFWEHPAVEGVTFWGWKVGMWRSEQDALLWNDRGRPRPSFDWLEDYVDTASVAITVSDEIEEDGIPTGFKLEQNYPNPFNPSTTISYQIPINTNVTIKVYDQLGREVATLVNEMMPAGIHTTQFEARNLSSGVYYYMVKAGDMVQTKAMTLIK